MRDTIDVFQYAPQILSSLKRGALLTTAADGKSNSMTIGWGTLGIEWSEPVFITYVRLNRYTHQILERNAEFTINVPLDDQGPDEAARVRRILSVCGTKSGRDLCKAQELSLTLVDGERVSVPAVRELPITLECQVIYKRDQDISLLPAGMRAKNYPHDEDGLPIGENGDLHTEYYGRIVDAYILS